MFASIFFIVKLVIFWNNNLFVAEDDAVGYKSSWTRSEFNGGTRYSALAQSTFSKILSHNS